MSNTSETIVSSVEVNVPSWMDDATSDMVKEIMEFLCESISQKMPDGINGVAVSYAMINIIIATLGSAFKGGTSDVMKANVLLVAVGLDDLLSSAISEMEKRVNPEVMRLIVETEGTA